MEIFQLRYFAAAARAGSFSRAAEDVCVSQPSLSLQIGQLEREVGAALFVRQGRGVRLTDAGVVLRDYAERILAQEAEARRAVRAVAGLERGRLPIWTLPTPGQHLLPALLARFRRERNGIEIAVHEATPARAVAEAVASGVADLGFVHLPVSVAGLAIRPLLTEELALVAPLAHPLAQAGADAPRLADLANEDFVWAPEGATPEHPLYAACLAAGFTPRIVCVSGSAQGMQALVAAGLGIALLPCLAIHPPPGAVTIALAAPAPTRTVAVVWRGVSPDDTASLSHAARAFLALVTNALVTTDGTEGPRTGDGV